MHVFHYTNKKGYNAIRSQPDWTFKANKPKARDRPKGAYFTTLTPTLKNLRSLHARIRVPRKKRQFVLWFDGGDGLKRLNDGRGRDRRILYSRTDYVVTKESERQRGAARTEDVSEDFE